MGLTTRLRSDLSTLKLISLSVGAVSLAATVVASCLFLRMRRSFRHDLVLLLFLGDFIKGICFIAYPIGWFSTTKLQIPAQSASCQAEGYLLAVGTEASDIAVLLIALHTALYIFRPTQRSGKNGLYPYRRYAYTFYFLCPILLASLAFIRGLPAYEDTGESCYLSIREKWYREALAWIPRYIVFITIVLLYTSLFIYVGYSQRKYSSEHATPRASFSLEGEIGDRAPPNPSSECHALIPETPPTGSSSRRESRGVAARKSRDGPSSSETSVCTIKLESRRRDSGKAVAFPAQMAVPEEAVCRRETGLVEAVNKGAGLATRRRPAPQMSWNWAVWDSSRLDAPSFPSRDNRWSDWGVSPRTEHPDPFTWLNPPPPTPTPAVKLCPPQDMATSCDHSVPQPPQDRRRLSVPVVVPPPAALPTLRRTSSLQAVVSAVRPSQASRRMASPAPAAINVLRDSTATRTRCKRFSWNSWNSNAASSAHESTTTTTASVLRARSRVRRHVRLLFVYPLVYIAMWLVPFLSHVMGFDDANTRGDPLWVVSLGTASLSVQGAVNAALFLWREKPWRHLHQPHRPAGSGSNVGVGVLWRSLLARLRAGVEECRRARRRFWWLRCPIRAASRAMRRARDRRLAAAAALDRSAVGRTREEMRSDGQKARVRREEEVLGEERLRSERAAVGVDGGGNAHKWRTSKVPKYWWDVEAGAVVVPLDGESDLVEDDGHRDQGWRNHV